MLDGSALLGTNPLFHKEYHLSTQRVVVHYRFDTKDAYR